MPANDIDALKKALDQDGIHTYSNPKGEKFFLEACAKYMKRRFGVELNPATEICSLIGSKEGIVDYRIQNNNTVSRMHADIIIKQQRCFVVHFQKEL